MLHLLVFCTELLLFFTSKHVAFAHLCPKLLLSVALDGSRLLGGSLCLQALERLRAQLSNVGSLGLLSS